MNSHRLITTMIMAVITAICSVVVTPLSAQPAAPTAVFADRVEALDTALDLSAWVTHAKLADSVLHDYTGLLTDTQAIAESLLRRMNRDPMGPNSLNGSWTADVPGRYTFDEGAQGDAIAILSLIYRDIGNYTVRGPNNELWSVLNALQLSVRCAMRYQFQSDPHWPVMSENGYGVPGWWPQSPGADPRYYTRNRLVFPDIENLRTLNDGCTSRMTRGLVVWLSVMPPELVGANDVAAVRRAVLLAGEGTWFVQQRNHGALPEQITKHGDGVWARGHEPGPRVVSSRATAYAVEIYQDCHAITGDQVWLDRAQSCIDWFDQVEWSDGVVFDFYDAVTLRPCWGDRYQLVFSPPTGVPRVEPHPARVRTNFSRYRTAVTVME